MNLRFGSLARLAKRMVSRLIRFYTVEQERRHADIQHRVVKLEEVLETVDNRLAAIQATQQRAKQVPIDAPTARELVRIAARLNALEGCVWIYASKSELVSARAEAARSYDALRLFHEETSMDAGSHRSFMERELQRNSRQADLHRQRIEAALDAVLERLSALEVTLMTAISVAKMKATANNSDQAEVRGVIMAVDGIEQKSQRSPGKAVAGSNGVA